MMEDARELRWTISLALVLLVAHAAAYLTHEYAHSSLAWLLGWMPSPWALDYGQPTIGNLLLLSDVSDNVSYDPIMRAGDGVAAASIALAGPFVGNGLLYVLTYAVTRRWSDGRGAFQICAFAFALMCAGNVWSYVPIRALTTHADIAIAARGFGISPISLFPFVFAPSLVITWHFFAHACRRWLPLLAKDSSTRLAVLCSITGYWFFGFFGGTARDGSYGDVSQLLSLTSLYVLFPLSVAWLWQRQAKKPIGS